MLRRDRGHEMLRMVAQMTFTRSERAHGKDALGCYDRSGKLRRLD